MRFFRNDKCNADAISRDPFVTTLAARLRCAQHNINANF